MLASRDAADPYVRRDLLLAMLALGFAAALLGFGVTHHAAWDPHELDAGATPLVGSLSRWLGPRRAHALIGVVLVGLIARAGAMLGGRRAALPTACVALAMPGLVAGARLTATSLEPALGALLFVTGALGASRARARRVAVDVGLLLCGAALLCVQEPDAALAPALAVAGSWAATKPWRARAACTLSVVLGALVVAEGTSASAAPVTTWARPLEVAVYAALPWAPIAPWALFAIARRPRAWVVLAWLALELLMNGGRFAWLPVALAVGALVARPARSSLRRPAVLLSLAVAAILTLDLHRDLAPLASVAVGARVDPAGVGPAWTALGAGAIALTILSLPRLRRAAAPASLIVGAVLAHGWLPALSDQLGHGALFESLPDDAELGVRGLRPEVAARWAPTELRTNRDLLGFLDAPGPRYAATPRDGYCALRQAARAEGRALFTIGADARFLMLANRAGEHDHDPLAGLIEDHPAEELGRPVRARLEGVELLGVSLPPCARRGSTLHAALHLRVTAPLRRSLRVLVHVDGPGGRFQGDHDPVDGLCPTSLWRVGDHVTDRFTFQAGTVTHAPGRYAVHVGLYSGAPGRWRNLPVIDGPSDGHDRVYAGELELR